MLQILESLVNNFCLFIASSGHRFGLKVQLSVHTCINTLSFYITNKTYIPNINLTKINTLKPRSGDISLFFYYSNL